MKNRRWLIPLVLLLIIIGASVLRWDLITTEVVDGEVIKLERDRWTGDLWRTYIRETTNIMMAGHYPGELSSIEGEISFRKMQYLTSGRNIIAFIMILWLAFELNSIYRARKTIRTTTLKD